MSIQKGINQLFAQALGASMASMAISRELSKKPPEASKTPSMGEKSTESDKTAHKENEARKKSFDVKSLYTEADSPLSEGLRSELLAKKAKKSVAEKGMAQINQRNEFKKLTKESDLKGVKVFGQKFETLDPKLQGKVLAAINKEDKR